MPEDEEENSSSRYEKVWTRVKMYIPFLQELISFYKNDTQQNRKQQLQKITTMYDLLTNQRLNYGSLCKCETVLVKLYETNPLKKKKTEDATESNVKPSNIVQSYTDSETPASPTEPDRPLLETADGTVDNTSITGEKTGYDLESEVSGDHVSALESSSKTSEETVSNAKPHNSAERDTQSKCDISTESEFGTFEPLSPESPSMEPEHESYLLDESIERGMTKNAPLSLDTIQRLITERPQITKNLDNTSNQLSKAIKDTLNVLSKDFRPPFKDTLGKPVSYDDFHGGGESPNISHTPNQSHYNRRIWIPDNDTFPHSAAAPVSRSYNINESVQGGAPKSPPLYRRRDDLTYEENRFRSDVSPLSTSSCDGRSPPVVTGTNIKDPRLRKAMQTNIMHSPASPDQVAAYFPSPSNNYPHSSRSNFPEFHSSSKPVPNDLPKCVAPNPNLPLDSHKKEPPKRRPSICMNQVIIEEIPPEPILPPKMFPQRRQSICSDYTPHVFNEPYGTSYGAPMQTHMPPLPPLLPPPQPPPPPPGSHHPHPVAHPHLVAPHQATPPSIIDRDPRRRYQPPTEFIAPVQQPHRHYNVPFDRTAQVIPKTPQTYLEYRRQKEMREKEAMEQRIQQKKLEDKNKNKDRDNTPSDNLDITIGMVPTNNRVAAKAYARPAKSAGYKERQFAPSVKDKHDNKYHKSHKQKDIPSKFDKKREVSKNEKSEKYSSAHSKTKDLFGETLSQFDKMYRSGDFSKKSATSGFKIPKVKKNENVTSGMGEKTDKNKTEKIQHSTSDASQTNSNSMSNEEEMWDTDDQLETPIKCTKTPDKAKNSSADEKVKTKTSHKTLDDEDDLWDDIEPPTILNKDSSNKGTSNYEQDHSSEQPTKDSTEQTKTRSEVELPKAKTEDNFTVPTKPAPHRIKQRRNSVAVYAPPNTLLEKPVSVSLPNKPPIKRRRNSIAVSQTEDEEVASKKKSADLKEIKDVIQPLKTRKRKANTVVNAEEIITKQLDKKLHESNENRLSEIGKNLEKENNEDMVSSTTNEVNENKLPKKRGRKVTKKPNKKMNKKSINKKDACKPDVTNELNEEGSVQASSSVQGNKTDNIEEDQPKSNDSSIEANKDAEIGESSTNPGNKLQLLAMLSQILDEKKLKKIQEIIESPSDKSIPDDKKENNTPEAPSMEILNQPEGPEGDDQHIRSRTTSASISSTNETLVKDKNPCKKSKMTELDKLNADIAEMYIRDGVLNATGRRSCTKRPEVIATPPVIPKKKGAKIKKNKKSTSKVSPSKDVKKTGPLKRPTVPVNDTLSAIQIKDTPLTIQANDTPLTIENNITPAFAIRNLKVVVIKMDLSKIEGAEAMLHSAIQRSEEKDMVADLSPSTSLSPKSKKKRKAGAWASGNVPKKKQKTESPLKHTISASPVKTYLPKPVTKNINRELHCKNEKSKECALCSYTGSLSNMVQHYVRNHPLHEVYISRIPNVMANKLRKEPTKVVGEMNDQNITFQCIFCQENHTKKKYNWKLHLASHTGEYRYKCNNCTVKSLAPCTNAHDRDCNTPAMEVINALMFEENHIYAYMCRACNYVQLARPNLVKHIKEEHDRQYSAKNVLRFSVLNYKPSEVNDQTNPQDTLDSDVSMPELTPQINPGEVDMSAFIPTSSEEIESLKVLNDQNFVSPSKPSIIDKLKQNFDEIMRNEAKKGTPHKKTESKDYDEWEDIETPPKSLSNKTLSSQVDKVKRSLNKSGSPKLDIPMPVPLSLKEEKVDIFETKSLVANMAYNRVNDKVWYICSIGECKYATVVRLEMYCHVKEQHSSIVWDGFCYLCMGQVVDDEISELAKEVKHMAVIHIKDRSAFDEMIPSSTAKSESPEEDATIKNDNLSLGTPAEKSSSESVTLKPWLTAITKKNVAHSLNMLEKKSLFCFYKCMATSCCFTTTQQNKMEKHLANHELVGEVDRTDTLARKSWLECAYCDFYAEGNKELMSHLNEIHGKSVHQCAYCFYRSRDAYNVVLHQKLHHEKKKHQILIIEADKQLLTPEDQERLNRRRIDNILPLICTVCKAEFCVLDAFMSHLKDDHADLSTILCQCCLEDTPKLKMPRHLLIHKIGIYECLFCQFGTNTLEAIQAHVCNLHSMEPLYCCVRYNKTPGKVKEASLKSLNELAVEDNFFVYCPYTIDELDSKPVDTKSNHEIIGITPPTIIPLQLPPIRVGDSSILLSAQIPSANESSQQSVVVNKQAVEFVKMPTISAVSGGVTLSTPMPIITAVQGSYNEVAGHSLPIISHVTGGIELPTGSLLSSMPVITRVEGGVTTASNVNPSVAVTPSSSSSSSLIGAKIIISPNKGPGIPIITNVCSMSGTSAQIRMHTEDEAIMLEAERVAMEMIKDTGLSKEVIYKCVFKGCNAVLPDGTGMRKHLTFTHLPSNQYVCVHCKNKPSFVNIMTFTQHLKTHEAQRIFCFICDYKGSFPPEVIKHVKDVHKASKPTILFLNPKKNDPNNDIILFAPGQPTDSERKAFYRKLIDLYNHKLQEALIQQKTHFAPEECDSLPKQAIFSQWVYCSKCQYGTKVRLNMYRHLKGHLNDMPVSNIDPKNPVPCWGQGEKHFDRMRNPAASSQEDDDLIQSLCFVQENKRYICGAPDCRYLTINENMLRNHLACLHLDVKTYKCPHCPAVNVFSAQLSVLKVLEHLKLHDKELYRCSHCNIFLNNKDDMEKHITATHASVENVSVLVIRDGSSAGSMTGSIVEGEVIFKWKCDVCKYKSVSLSEMRSHMQATHNITAKYRCSRCLYSCSNKSLFTTHFEKQHPDQEIVIISMYKAIDGDDSRADTTPLWRRDVNKTKSIRGILVDDEDEDEDDSDEVVEVTETDVCNVPLSSQSDPGPSRTSINSSNPSVTSINQNSATIKAFKCGFKGCSYLNDYGSGIVIHFKTAHPNEKPSVLRNTLASQEQSRFDYFLKYACFYCIKKADTIQELVQHWTQMHLTAGYPSPDRPFLFRTTKILLCFYCRKGAVMPEMRSHFSTCHRGVQPIYLDFRNPKRCAECDFTMENNKTEMYQHFSAVHKQENIHAKGWVDYLTDDVVDKILQLNSSTYHCEKCNFQTEIKSNITKHYSQQHPKEAIEFKEFPIHKTIIYSCAYNNCKSNFKSAIEIARHIMQHVPCFKCHCDERVCAAQFRTFVMLLQHCKVTHKHQDLKYSLKTSVEFQQILRMVTLQFWNGFVMSLDEARHTDNKYGKSVFKCIDDLCAESVETGSQLL